ncbi:transcriptional regulator [Streptomyces qinglanensis]|uniref:Transcriptional regulator n=1 Tax=Streptomyces qinglanensis TaxID=943816 RepID=A0A1E7K8B9_9ACTN|nr:MerR family transcriptional regulator [Streptomyces qinglanensis]OEV00168.1 transcriptional regulator [Streptomyces qinglanensis]OEV28151.1 transcriptional regulator [Streptomyces nanshensis]
MRMAELSERSGVPTATIKYYLREGLLPRGHRVNATQAEYGEDHVRRLRLVRALIQVGRMPVTTAREVLAAVDDASLSQHERLGTAAWALPRPVPPRQADTGAGDAGDAADAAAARREVTALLDGLGWQQAGPDSPPGQALTEAVAALTRLGYPCTATHLALFARAAERTAGAELDLLESFPDQEAQVEASVALTVLYEPVLLSLRRLAHVEESARRFGTEG